MAKSLAIACSSEPQYSLTGEGVAVNPDQDGKIFIGKGTKPEYLTLALANRHGFVAGATGTGKTVTLQVLAEGFSRAGVSVFAVDVKGDLSGIAAAGEPKEALVTRAKDMGFDYQPNQFPVVFWDFFGEQGHPVRFTVSEIGPLLLSRLLNLDEEQERALNIAFRAADEHGLLVDDLKDLREFLNFLAASEWTIEYGRVSKSTVGTIQRQILVLENQGGRNFFGLPTLKLDDFMHTNEDGRGRINILAANKLMQNQRMYATLVLWLLSRLFEDLPEVGDSPMPKLVLFFDEAQLLFADAPKAVLDGIEKVVRSIGSKGVGVYFVTQNPLDVPDKILGQLENRIQHALRPFTPKEQKAVKAAAQTFRPNPAFNTTKVIMELGKGEALLSLLDGDGIPMPVERARIRPPTARLGPVTPEERKALIDLSPLKGKYEQNVDRESAHEVLTHGIPVESPGEAVVIRGELGQTPRSPLFAFVAHLLDSKAVPTEAEQDQAYKHAFDLIARGVPVKIICGASPSIRLSRSEDIRCVIPGTTLSEARAVRSWRSVYGGPSIRVAKGLSFRFGQSGGVSESHDELRPVDRGTLVVTTQRLVFLGSQRTTSTALPKIIEIKPYSDGLQVHRQDKQKAELFLFNDNLRVSIPDADGKTISAPLNGGLLTAIINQLT
jgi:DNA helicase HerA-like ATPase